MFYIISVGFLIWSVIGIIDLKLYAMEFLEKEGISLKFSFYLILTGFGGWFIILTLFYVWLFSVMESFYLTARTFKRKYLYVKTD